MSDVKLSWKDKEKWLDFLDNQRHDGIKFVLINGESVRLSKKVVEETLYCDTFDSFE